MAAGAVPKRMSKADLLGVIGRKLTREQLIALHDAVLDNKESQLLNNFLENYRKETLV